MFDFLEEAEYLLAGQVNEGEEVGDLPEDQLM
jgi:hypothetical protein